MAVAKIGMLVRESRSVKLDTSPWPAITAAFRKARRRRIAVSAYLGSAADELLALRADDELYVNASEAAVICGQTDPRVLRRLVGSHVRCFSVRQLHAKVYVADDSVFIGSPNASQNSAANLIEVCVRIDNRHFAASVVAWISELDAELLDEGRIAALEDLYEPPRCIEHAAQRRKSGRDSSANRLWFTWVETYFEEPNTTDYRQWQAACKAEVRPERRFRLWEIAEPARSPSALFGVARIGDHVVVVDHPTMEVYGPMRVLNAAFKSNAGPEALRILGVEEDSRQPRLTYGRLRQALHTRNVAKMPPSGRVNRLVSNARTARAIREYLATRK